MRHTLKKCAKLGKMPHTLKKCAKLGKMHHTLKNVPQLETRVTHGKVRHTCKKYAAHLKKNALDLKNAQHLQKRRQSW